MVRKFSHHCSLVRTSSWVRIFAPLFMGANFRTTVHGCEFSHHCSWVRNFRTSAKIFQFVPLTSDDHNFFVQTPFEVFLDSMESPLSQESRFMPVEDKWGSQPYLNLKVVNPTLFKPVFFFLFLFPLLPETI